jgi:hypothetical protein
MRTVDPAAGEHAIDAAVAGFVEAVAGGRLDRANSWIELAVSMRDILDLDGDGPEREHNDEKETET